MMIKQHKIVMKREKKKELKMNDPLYRVIIINHISINH